MVVFSASHGAHDVVVTTAGHEAQLAWHRMALPVVSALHFQKAAARRTQSSAAETPQASPSEPDRGPGTPHTLALGLLTLKAMLM